MNRDLEKILKHLNINAATKVTSSALEHTHPINSSQRGLPKGWTRTTFIIKEEHVQKLKEIAYWERITIKKLIEEALTTYFESKSLKADLQKKK